jgi:hypothetical protein
MKTCRCTDALESNTHLIESVETKLGRSSTHTVCSIADQDVEKVFRGAAAALQEYFQLPVYLKENISASSKSVTIGIFWSSLWVYFSFMPRNKNIRVVVSYRKQPIAGTHFMINKV